MAVAYRVIRTARRALLAAVLSLVIFTIFIMPTNVPAGLGPFRIINKLDAQLRRQMEDVDDRAFASSISTTHDANKLWQSSSSTKAPGPLSITEEDQKRIARLVNRILEIEQSLADCISHGARLDARQSNQLQLLTSQMKLVKSLLLKSVFMMKLADLASHGRESSFAHGMESSSWIAWDHLEPATRDLENDVKSFLVLRIDERRHGYGTTHSVAATSLVVIAMVMGLVFYAVKLTRRVRTRSLESMM